jgi:hypothetical protein
MNRARGIHSTSGAQVGFLHSRLRPVPMPPRDDPEALSGSFIEQEKETNKAQFFPSLNNGFGVGASISCFK